MENIKKHIVGTWRLVHSINIDSNGHTEYPYGQDAIGYIYYGDTGIMAVQISRKVRTNEEDLSALKHMKSGGRIISIGSAVGESVLVPGLVPYSATKGAVKIFTQGLSRELGSRGITVNNVQPGPIDTDLNPAVGDWAVPQKAFTALDRYGRVDEVAALVAFVAGPESSYITGANLTVDGGMNA